jgi:hypothetical protein
MKVGDLVRHWTYDLGLGLVVDIDLTSSCVEDFIDYKVHWPNGECGWYTFDRLEKAAVCK